MTQAAHVAQHPPAEETSTGLNHRKLLMWTFLGSDCMFFGSFIAAYLVYRNRSIEGPFPADVLDIPITSISTFVLLMSSVAMVLALYYTQQNRRVFARYWTLAVCALGAGFLGFQVFEFYEFVNHEPVGLTPRTNLFGTTFFTLTGFHGAHVTLGVLWLLVYGFTQLAAPGRERVGYALVVVGYMAGFFAILGGPLHIVPGISGALSAVLWAVAAMGLAGGIWLMRRSEADVKIATSALDLEIAGLYWHFVDIVWIVIFTVIYLISASDSGPLGGLLHG